MVNGHHITSGRGREKLCCGDHMRSFRFPDVARYECIAVASDFLSLFDCSSVPSHIVPFSCWTVKWKCDKSFGANKHGSIIEQWNRHVR